ncbi:unnamed protein product [Enterobius vermicularis]|uniref:Galactosylgalactosylxylosylprotein 3-beta-glucuronosyltransferase n=1 Tax=Enterobius vermicularis TaxID=51028 RepID=A0A0N4VN08_ENTVE|nr:unnamed protein product [Enterobius vermicularis]
MYGVKKFKLRHIYSYFLTILLLILIYEYYSWNVNTVMLPTIIVITPTYSRPERIADMTRFSQTLMHIKNLHWIVIEDGNKTVDAVKRLLARTGLIHTYFYTTTEYKFPRRGWSHRNAALMYIRKNYASYRRPGVVFFADDDNSYDIRLFNDYIRNVKTIGFWAVGLAGAAKVEAPHVENGTIVGWDVVYAPKRKFASDMAGFAVNLKLILTTNASFHRGCVKRAPETCFLEQFKVRLNETQAFGWDQEPKDILVWHTKTRNIGTQGEKHGYVVEP